MWCKACDAKGQVSKSLYVNQSLIETYHRNSLPLEIAASTLFSQNSSRIQFLYANLHAIGCASVACQTMKAPNGTLLQNVTMHACILGFKSEPVDMTFNSGACTQCPTSHPKCLDGLCAETQQDKDVPPTDVWIQIDESFENSTTGAPHTTIKFQLMPGLTTPSLDKGPMTINGMFGEATTETTVGQSQTSLTSSSAISPAGCSSLQRSGCEIERNEKKSELRTTMGIAFGVIGGVIVAFLLVLVLVVLVYQISVYTRRKTLERRRSRGVSTPQREDSFIHRTGSVYSTAHPLNTCRIVRPPPYTSINRYQIPPPAYSEIFAAHQPGSAGPNRSSTLNFNSTRNSLVTENECDNFEQFDRSVRSILSDTAPDSRINRPELIPLDNLNFTRNSLTRDEESLNHIASCVSESPPDEEIHSERNSMNTIIDPRCEISQTPQNNVIVSENTQQVMLRQDDSSDRRSSLNDSADGSAENPRQCLEECEAGSAEDRWNVGLPPTQQSQADTISISGRDDESIISQQPNNVPQLSPDNEFEYTDEVLGNGHTSERIISDASSDVVCEIKTS